MTVKTRYLTKSRFKTAYECPAKLYYSEHPETYANKNVDNEFLKALAKGGFQVGALAKLYYPGGIDLEGLSTADGIAKTAELLQQEKITIFEAALVSGPFLVRVDVLVKDGSRVKLIEVKSKSFHSKEDTSFRTQKGTISSEWEPYLIDVAFQSWVAKQAHPDWQVSSCLMLVDKSEQASVDGLHQNFKLTSSNLRDKKVVTREGLSVSDLGTPLLKEVPVDREVDILIHEDLYPGERKFDSFAKYLAEHHQAGTCGEARLAALCKNCEFRSPPELLEKGQRSAFLECWGKAGKITAQDVGRPLVFDIWKTSKTQELLSNGKYFMDQLTEDDLKPKTKSKGKPGRRMEPWARQWLQVEKAVSKDPTPYIDTDGIRELLGSVTWPLHMIDFETTMVAIPFHKGRRPYEQIAFQFSHHTLSADGQVRHVDQYLDMRPGAFPNFEFVRRLKASLSADRGTIFRYADHENTVLRQIRRQLLSGPPENDQDELIAFIDSITRPTGKEEGNPGSRNMLDLRQLVLDLYLHPLMGGSNSIKKVIPAVLQESKYLRDKYSKPIYGKGCEIPSLNLGPTAWIQLDEQGNVRDPYKLLPPVFADIDQKVFSDEAPLFEDDSIDDGGAAMTAWSRAQFTEMREEERGAISQALLKYCELDTLSMVWILEYFKTLIT